MATPAAIARLPLQKVPLGSVVSTRPARDLPRPSPFIKWVGGKGRLMAQLEPLLPRGVERMRHVEPFVGGGAMFFARQPERAVLSDINPDLVHVYRSIRDDVQGVIRALGPLAAAGNEPETYYAVRERYNAGEGRNKPLRAALFIYLNKTCFNGLHRVNQRGHFNVPAGRYKNPTILDPSGLLAASVALAHADVRQAGFEELLSSARPGDFVYFDPPYEPVSTTASFTGYARDGFSQDDQTRLRDVFKELHRRGCKLMLSNSDVPFIRELYGDFHISTIEAARAINSNGLRRGKVSEVVVRNYA
ncbi:MAG: DNA adenine methylase [Myxococcales bacterium]|nr:DNA adenine methylase [Myxococcales bacterium]MCB9625865.1 DNA adenine methylase [Sandaracinaceae bacterium]